MKRPAQIAVTLVIALLAGMPAAAALICSVQMGDKGSTCPLIMSEMDSDCPMTQKMGVGGLQECCDPPAAQLTTPFTLAVRPKATTVVPAALIPVEEGAATSTALELTGPPPASSPPRYILNRVFRI